jgi:hypothetical protein
MRDKPGGLCFAAGGAAPFSALPAVLVAAAAFVGLTLSGCAGMPAGSVPPKDEDGSIRPEIPVFFRGAAPEETAMVLDAYRRVTGFYEELGFPIPDDEAVTFHFADVLTVDGKIYEHAHGLYRKDVRLVRMVSVRSESFRSSRILGEPEESELFTSLLCHELAHFANTLHSPGMHPVIDECLAAYVQLSVTENPVKDAILTNNREVEFTSYRDISVLTYVLDPPGFIAAAYRYCRDNPKMVRRFLAGVNPMIKDPFFID